MTTPLLLLPPSKGKADGGDGPAYARTIAADHPLAAPRRAVLEAVAADAPHLDDRALARLAGVARRDVDAQRAVLPRLADAPTLPAHRRYTGVVHGNAGLAELDPDTTGVAVRIVSALLGLVAPGEPVPTYRLELAANTPTLGGLGPFWRDALAEHLAALGRDGHVWDLLPGEHRRVWTPAVRDALDVVDVRFQRPDGRAANAARTKVAKGRLAAGLIADPTLAPEELSTAVDLGPGWRLATDGPVVTATFTG